MVGFAWCCLVSVAKELQTMEGVTTHNCALFLSRHPGKPWLIIFFLRPTGKPSPPDHFDLARSGRLVY
jgi:hypothetical protein